MSKISFSQLNWIDCSFVLLPIFWGFYLRENFKDECGCVHFFFLKNTHWTLLIGSAIHQQILQKKNQPWVCSFLLQTYISWNLSGYHCFCLTKPWERGCGSETESWKWLMFLFLKFLHPFIMQGWAMSEVCWMLRFIMAEVASPDEYQAYHTHHSDHHLPAAAPDSVSAAQTQPKHILEANFINIFNKPCSNGKG